MKIKSYTDISATVSLSLSLSLSLYGYLRKSGTCLDILDCIRDHFCYCFLTKKPEKKRHMPRYPSPYPRYLGKILDAKAFSVCAGGERETSSNCIRRFAASLSACTCVWCGKRLV